MGDLRKTAIFLSPIALAMSFYIGIINSKKYGFAPPLLTFATAFFGVVFLTWIARWVAFRFNILDHPDPRKIHAKPIPLLGGAAVFGAFYGAQLTHPMFTPQMHGIFAGVFLIFLSGLIDDAKGGISDKIRLVIQFAAAGIVIGSGTHLHFFTAHWWGTALSIFLSLMWLLGITNAVNFLDGMDGLCAGTGAIAAGTFFAIAYQMNNPSLGFISAALCGACAGFLVHNFKPAGIFLGDAGSTTIGFLLACLGLLGDWSHGNPFISFSVPVLVLSVPIFDMIYTTVERFWSGKVHNISEWMKYTGRDHFHHRLVTHGFGQVQTVLFIYFVSITLGLTAIVITRCTSMIQVLLMLAQSAFVFLIIIFLMFVYRSNGNGYDGEKK